MSIVKRVHQGLESPNLIGRELNRYYHHFVSKRARKHGTRVFDEDWDNLVILDACRYDTFRDVHNLRGQLQKRYSLASSTIGFLRANLDGRSLEDTVYVTANPMYYRNRDDIDTNFHSVVNIWRNEGWNEEFRTILPETTTKYALDAAQDFRRKRLVVHYIQPHYPFIGPKGQEYFDLESLGFWRRVMTGEVDIPERVLWEAYRENLELVLPHVQKLQNRLSGRTIVTADHGQMIGESSSPLPIAEYGHPPGIHTEELLAVPWLVSENGPRKTIVADEGESHSHETGDEVVRERLRDLGYAE